MIKHVEKISISIIKHVDVNASRNIALRDGDGTLILRYVDVSLYSDFIFYICFVCIIVILLTL